MDIKKEKWAKRMLKLAQEVASWSKDESTKVGAVITTIEGAPVSWGFNGMAMGVDDTVSTRHERPHKYKWMCHAERNAMDLAPRPLDNCVMFVTFFPCSSCSQSIIQRRIKSVVVDEKYSAENMPERWKEDMMVSQEMLLEAGVNILKIKVND